MIKTKANLGDTLRIVKQDENSIEHNCIGPVVGIQQLSDGSISYTLKIVVVTESGLECETHCNVRDGEFVVIEEERELIDLDDVEFVQ